MTVHHFTMHHLAQPHKLCSSPAPTKQHIAASHIRQPVKLSGRQKDMHLDHADTLRGMCIRSRQHKRPKVSQARKVSQAYEAMVYRPDCCTPMHAKGGLINVAPL